MKGTCSDWRLRLGGRALLVYGGSILGVGAALLVTELLSPLHSTPTVLFFAVVVAAAWVGGRGPALFATLSSVLAVDFFLIHPRLSFLSELADLVRLTAFTLVALLTSYLQGRYQRSAAQLRQANDMLEIRVQERTADLTAEIQERRRAEVALKESEARLRVAIDTTEVALKEKEVLLRELRHRVKNNLQIITSLLSLHSGRIHDRSSQELLKECQQRVRVIALVHERLYKAPHRVGVDLAAYMHELVQDLFRCYSVNSGMVTPRVMVEDVTLRTDQLIPCALVVNELVCNALKYAFPDGRSGEVRVEFRRRDGQVCLTVADDGVGFASREGRRGHGLGHQLVQALVDQLSGKLEWANVRGTSATVTFPEPNYLERGNSHVSDSDPRG